MLAISLACTASPQDQLTSAVLRGDINEVESLLDDPNVDINWRASRTGDSALSVAAAHNQLAIVRLLLRRGADPRIATYENMTPLHSAAYHGYAEIVKLLIDAGANVNAVEARFGFTPLAHAARNGNVQVIELLLDAGANREIAVKDGRTPIAVARQYGKSDAVNALRNYQPTTTDAR